MKLPKLLNWFLLRQLAEVRLVTSMYIWLIVVPMLAKLFNHISGTASLKVFGYKFELDLRLPFTWEIFYFSALAFTLGNIVFLSKCPRIVKDHKTASECRQTGKGIAELDDYAEDAKMPREKYDQPKAAALGNPAYNSISNQPDGAFNELFWLIHKHANRERPVWLCCASFMYLLGLQLIACVFSQNLLAVLRLVA